MSPWKFPIFLFALLCPFSGKAQSIQLFTEDFQLGGNSFTLNGAGPGTGTGSNQWIVNDIYSGAPTYPNTFPQDSTYSGTIGFAPYSKYLHIYDSNSGIANANYNPAATSDQFAYMTSGLCTYGMDSVHFSFFYLCEGSSTAFGSVYYSINNGPWIQTGQSLYNNKYKWKFEDISDPAFSNVGNLRFGFRWENDNSGTPFSESFSIDDINIVSSYNPVSNPISITIDSVVPDPVCQGTNLYIYYTISDTLCDGSYIIELSNSSGNFPGSNSWIYNIYYPQTSGAVFIQLPNLATPASCYKVRISRNSPAPMITGTASACFTIIDCPNVITTNQPVITFDTNAVCIGSVIDIPFFSTGVYTFNTYTAQLSDSDGTFPANPTVVGTYFNSTTYDPALGSLPGSVSGLVPDVVPGCNYYIRVVSSTPAATGTVWGPFCIQECDITTNNKMSLQFCVTDCSADPFGADTTVTVTTNTFDSTAVYNPGNQFLIQLLDKMFFMQVGSPGAIGSVTATSDTTFSIHIPCKDSLAIVGVPAGSYYMRIIATNSSVPENSLGTLINVSIGAPHAIPPVITAYDYNTYLPKDTFCTGEYVGFYFNPYNYFDKSTYLWQSPLFFGGNPFSWSNVGGDPNSNYNPYLFTLNSPGIITMKVFETNYGCPGPWSTIDTVVFLGPPAVPITGPNIVCQGDTNHYEVPFFDNTYYSWTANNGLIIDTSNNVIDVSYSNTGTYQIKLNAINQCGLTTTSKIIQVKPYPVASGGNDTTVCSNYPVTLSTPTGIGYTYLWGDGYDTLGTTYSVTVYPDSTTLFFVTVTGQGGCKSMDTVIVFTLPGPILDAGTDTLLCMGNPVQLSTPFSVYYSYSWFDGTDTISTISNIVVVPDTSTSYYLSVVDSSGCVGKDTVAIMVQPYPDASAGNDTNICKNNAVVLSTFYSPGYSYSWSDGGGTLSISNTLPVTPLATSTYFLSVADTAGCVSYDTVSVFVFDYPLADAGPDTAICQGGSFLLSTASGNNYSFSWSDATGVIGTNSSVTVSPNTTTSFFLDVTGAGDCATNDTITLAVFAPPFASKTDSVCPEGITPVTLSSEAGDSYLWSTGATTRDILVTETGTYTVAVHFTDSICEKTISFDLVPKECPEFSVVFPNIFSPNGDGLNEIFTPILSANFDAFSIRIFNRWGGLVYESQEPFFQWNGKNLSGNLVSDGVYFYIAETVLRSKEKKYTGYVTVTK